MKEFTFSLTRPRDFYDEFARVSEGIPDESTNFHQGEGQFTIGCAEFLTFGNVNFAIITELLYKEETMLHLHHHYDQPWLLLVVQEIAAGLNFTLPSILQKNETLASTNNGFVYQTDNVKVWRQAQDSKQNAVLIYLQENWLKDKLAWKFSKNDDFYKHLEAFLISKNITNVCQTPKNKGLFQGLVSGIRNRATIDLENKQKNLSQLADSILNEVFENEFSDLPMNQKLEIKGIVEAEKFLVKNFQLAPPTLDELAKIAGVNRMKFQTLFKEIFSMTFYNYFQRERFFHAKKLIENQNLNIKEAAGAVGYKNVSHFSEQFEKIIGIKPSSLRKAK